VQKTASFCASLCAERIVAARREMQRRWAEERRELEKLYGIPGLANGHASWTAATTAVPLQMPTAHAPPVKTPTPCAAAGAGPMSPFPKPAAELDFRSAAPAPHPLSMETLQPPSAKANGGPARGYGGQLPGSPDRAAAHQVHLRREQEASPTALALIDAKMTLPQEAAYDAHYIDAYDAV
ncbi:unnamed protein product, partial [Polarella glacialis]